jgi:protein phosphatase
MTRNDATSAPRPRFTDIDAWGVTHTGLVRKDNQDHFFVGALARTDGVRPVSATEEAALPAEVERLASLGAVADGVGGVSGGKEAARVAIRELVSSVARHFDDDDVVDRDDPDAYSRMLQESALACHESLLQRSRDEGGGRQFATTITLFLGLWPHAYLLQVGDSRCYIYQRDKLTQITRDQTWAQDLIDAGTLSQTRAQASRWANVLSSTIGGQESAPVVTRIERNWGDVVLLCSDGLTKHVPDAIIERRISELRSARQLAEALLQDALDGGGTDNITIVVGRTVPLGAS